MRPQNSTSQISRILFFITFFITLGLFSCKKDPVSPVPDQVPEGSWINRNSTDPNRGNPICIHVWDDFPPGADITGYYYTDFDLTMRYFLDPIGLNNMCISHFPGLPFGASLRSCPRHFFIY